MRKLLVAVVGSVVVACALLMVSGARAGTTITVTSTADGTANANNCTGSAAATSCTLRDAVAYANANAGSVITLNPGTYDIAGQLLITEPVTINGASSSTTVIKQMTSGQRVLELQGFPGSTSITGVEITGGSNPSGGGGILINPSNGLDVTLTNDLIDGNKVLASTPTGVSAFGGGIEVSSVSVVNLTLAGTTVTANVATGAAGAAASGASGGPARGAGIYFQSEGLLSVGGGSAITSNIATGGVGGTAPLGQTVGSGGAASGAGIEAFPSTSAPAPGSLSVSNTTLKGNTATGGQGATAVSGQDEGAGGAAYGGGISVDGVSATVGSSTIEANSVTGGVIGTGGNAPGFKTGTTGGAGIYVDGSTTVTQSLIDGNTASAPANTNAVEGAGIQQGTGPLTLVNSTVYANTASGTGDPALGGGVFTGSTATLASDTLDQNAVSGTTDYGANLSAVGSTQVGSTAIADPNGGANCYYGNTTDIVDAGENLESDGTPESCLFVAAAGDFTGQNPEFGVLAANGAPAGAPESLLPAAGSPVIGHGGSCTNPAASPATSKLTVDQRGFPRPGVGGASACDIGALQIQGPANTSAPSITPAAPVSGRAETCGPGTWTGDGTITYAYAWLLDGTQVATGFSYVPATTDVGHVLSCSVTGSTPYGRTATAQSTGVTVSAPPPATTTTVPGTASVTLPTGTTTPAKTTTLPAKTPVQIKVSKAGLTHKSFRESGKAAKGKPPVGTSFHFTLSAAATVHIVISHTVKGVVVKKKCVAAKRGLKGKACTLRVTNGTLSLRGKKGANASAFVGKIGRTHLAAGRYQAVISVVEPKGAKASSATLAFTIAH